ncbi:MAG: C-terminal binding protein [Sedimentibacter sp.]|uniref:C-terminal binding protein n=1 Tax=Sedimentibacter sp. TaxID=1960295 RepID=UPI003158ACC3
MFNAILVDRDYGSVSLQKQELLKSEYEKNGIYLSLHHFKSEKELIETCVDADALLCTGNPAITENVINSLPNLKLVQRFGIGVNSIDLKAATRNGVTVLNMPGFCIKELAVHATSLILALLRNTAYYDREIRKYSWPKAKYFKPEDLSDLTVGLYGFGGSAKELYKIVHGGFGSKFIVCDPYVNSSVLNEYDIELVTFDEMLEKSDIISLNVPLTEETRGIFNIDTFKKMKDTSMIINIARGELIKEDDLVYALENSLIRFAGLDVFETEPLKNESKLRNMDNVVLTCHSAFYGVKSESNQISFANELVKKALIDNEVPIYFVANKDVIGKSKFNFIEGGLK